MKTQIKLLILLIIIGILNSSESSGQNKALSNYLETHWTSPDNYLIEKFKTHDYVFIGELHRLKHDVEFIVNLIPKLYENDIYYLGFEFGNYEDQYLVDSLLAKPIFDRELAKKIIFNFLPEFGYTEYIDVFKAAWEVNHSEGLKNKKFRIINISAKYDPCKKGGPWADIVPDKYMADVVFKEIVGKKEKALIYCGMHHSFTKFHMPMYVPAKDTLYGYDSKRLGNIVHDTLTNKPFLIVLHEPWLSAKNLNQLVKPVNGAIDSVMNLFNNKSVGFDVISTPFGQLTSNDSYYQNGYPNFTLKQFCDGYIFLKPIKEYKQTTWEKGFIDENNIEALRKFMNCGSNNKSKYDTLSIDYANELLISDPTRYFKNLLEK